MIEFLLNRVGDDKKDSEIINVDLLAKTLVCKNNLEHLKYPNENHKYIGNMVILSWGNSQIKFNTDQVCCPQLRAILIKALVQLRN